MFDLSPWQKEREQHDKAERHWQQQDRRQQDRWRAGDARVKACEAAVREADRRTTEAEAEAASWEARAQEMHTRETTRPPVETGCVMMAPAFAHGCKYGFHGAEAVRHADTAGRYARQAQQLRRQNRQLTDELQACDLELALWKQQPTESMHRMEDRWSARVQKAQAELKAAEQQRRQVSAECARQWHARLAEQRRIEGERRELEEDCGKLCVVE